jgi:hypothetical protein
MAVVILDPLPDSSGVPESVSPEAPDARYNFLAHSILGSLGENGGISLVVADSSVESCFLRETLEQIHRDLRVFEVPCRQAIANARIIPSLPQFISSASSTSRSLASPGTLALAIETRHAPMLFICDGAEGLEDEQLETMYRLSRGKHGPLGVVLLAKPEFLLRMQNSRLAHIKTALSACLWSQHSSYGAVCAADRQGRVDGFAPLDLAQLPSPLLERLTVRNGATVRGAGGSSIARNIGARLGRMQFLRAGRYRRRAITMAFSIGYLLIGGGTIYVLSWVSSQPQTAVARGEAPAQFPLTTSLLPRLSEAEDSAPVSPPSAAAPNLVVKDARAAPAITVLTNMPEKSAPSVPAANEAPEHKAGAVLAPAEPVESQMLPKSASVAVPPKRDIPAPEGRLSDADRALFAQRGNELLAAGDIASARLFFERAANAGDARSALGMAKTFDPVELAKAGVRGVKGDQAKADYWYQRAYVLAGDRNFENQVKENRRD